MTGVLVAFLLGLAAGLTAGIMVCNRWHAALRVDRDLHEQAAHAKGDAAWTLTQRIERRYATLRYLARLPQPRRVRVMSRYCTLLRREMAA